MSVLTKEERAHAVARIERDNVMFTSDSAEGKNIGWAALKFALKDWRKLLILLGQVCIIMPVVGFLVFTPVLVGGGSTLRGCFARVSAMLIPLRQLGMGFAGIKANLVSIFDTTEIAARMIADSVFIDVRHSLLRRLCWSACLPKELGSFPRAFPPHHRRAIAVVSSRRYMRGST